MAEDFQRIANNVQTLYNRGDETLNVRFFMKAIPDEVESQKQGHPCFREVEMIRIQRPGQRDEIAEREVWADPMAQNSDINRFRDAYRRWKQDQKSEGLVGLPILEWAGITRSQAEELRHFGCLTVEQLAAAADGVIAGFRGGYELKQKAVDFIAGAKSSAPLEQARAEIRERDAQLSAMSEQMKQLGDVVKRLETELQEQRVSRSKGKA